MKITDLPAELILHIFTFINPSDLFHCADISTGWKIIAEGQDLWKRHFTQLPFFYDKENLTEEWDFHGEVVKVIDFARGHIRKAEPHLTSYRRDKWLIGVYDFWIKLCHEDERIGMRNGNAWQWESFSTCVRSLEAKKSVNFQKCQHAERMLSRARMSHLILNAIGESSLEQAEAIANILQC